jgi:hypothetical protein
VETDHAVQRLGTPEEKDATVCVGLRNPKGRITYRPLIYEKKRIDRSSTLGERTLGESEGREFETPEARRDEVIHSHQCVRRHASIDRELWLEAFWEEASGGI